ncbi:MAG TPA: hypothetical protein ENK25_01030, partial [Bacteroidetes bacterium]|nr:hypothetical protein [Bacteroidota bacterium]
MGEQLRHGVKKEQKKQKDCQKREFFHSAGRLRGLKGSLHEGGIREPLVIRWPGKIKPGKVTDIPSA